MRTIGLFLGITALAAVVLSPLPVAAFGIHLVQRIEQVVQPTAQQQSAFDDLQKAAQKAGDQLRSSCPTAAPKSPVARLDTVETRLGAMVDAIETVRPNLKNFYASLSDEQKARFNLMGPPPKSASSPSER